MAFEGSLEDLSAVDVLQLLHVSKKTGVLKVAGPQGEARIAIKDGMIVGCQHPSPGKNVGHILVGMGALTQTAIEEAVAAQQAAGDAKKPFIQTLSELGHIEEQVGWQALKKLVEATVVEAVAWEVGTFTFEMVDVQSGDGFQHLPGVVAGDVNIDTQGALMEAMRILDERNREVGEQPRDAGEVTGDESDAPSVAPETSGEASPLAGPTPSDEPTAPGPASDDEQVEGPGAGGDEEGDLASLIGDRLENPGGPGMRRRAVMFCNDGFLKLSARAACVEQGIDLIATDVERDVTQRLAAWRADDRLAAVVVDVAAGDGDPRWARRSVALIRQVREAFPEIPMTVLSGPNLGQFTEAFGLGATSVLPRPMSNGDRSAYVQEMKQLFAAVTGCLQATFARHSALEERVVESQRRMADLRQRVQEIRNPNGPSDISLVVLRYVADFVDRCVLFLVRSHDLLGLGAFGVKDTDETLSRIITKLKIPFGNGSILADTIRRGEFYHGSGEDPLLQDHLYKGIGAPASPDIVLLPLKTRERTAALIYGDFGDREAEAVQTDALEILADHAGMAFELALWDKRVD